MDWLTKYENATEFYMDAQRRWPIRRSRPGGKWILASFDDESIVVYQAYDDEIAQFACENGHFIGCPGYNQQRMTWIKTNFLWMMHRSHWISCSNKKHLPPDKQSVTSNNTDQVRLKGRIRLQWDPDYDPHGTPIPYRRAIQLDLKKVDSFLDGRDILRIVDITSFVKNQYTNAVLIKGHRRRDQLDQLRVPIEHIYEPVDEQIRRHIQLDSWNAA
ncbi:unnamed protein product [Rotaria socialis]|uniref:Uncharacterized protein n=2 Tax=Rotaria socialis TaxID=392032 RepID=A0A817LBJ0_9BILA|nr:unnamed protein product [Rotaria socialis]